MKDERRPNSRSFAEIHRRQLEREDTDPARRVMAGAITDLSQTSAANREDFLIPLGG